MLEISGNREKDRVCAPAMPDVTWPRLAAHVGLTERICEAHVQHYHTQFIDHIGRWNSNRIGGFAKRR